MTTRLQAWGNSQGVRLPKALLAALQLEAGASVEIKLSPKKDAIIVKPAKAPSRVRGRHQIEDLVAAMPKGYTAAEFGWDASGREVW
jgi:antitoxin MazE